MFGQSLAIQQINDGRVIRQKLGFYLVEGTELVMWAHNKSGAVQTTGNLVRCYGEIYGNWQ